jgi:hypothetical protein
VNTPTRTTSSDGGGGDVGAHRAEEFAREHPAIVKLGRVGWVAKGIVYALVGVLSLAVGVGASGFDSVDAAAGGQEASQTGAITRIAESSFGAVLLFVLAAGLVIYAMWRLMSVVLPADNDIKAWLTRAGYLVSAVTYLFLAWSAVTLARRPVGSSGESEDARVERFTRDLMDEGLGRAAVFAIGLVLLVLAVVFLWQALSARFESQLLRGGVGPVSHRILVLLGRIGWVGRSGMMALIGFFLVRAALTFDPGDAEGLDGSLRKAASSTIGLILVLVVGAGLLVFGAFCVLSAPKQRMVGADS